MSCAIFSQQIGWLPIRCAYFILAFNKVAAALIFEAYLPTFSERNVTEHTVKPVLSGLKRRPKYRFSRQIIA